MRVLNCDDNSREEDVAKPMERILMTGNIFEYTTNKEQSVWNRIDWWWRLLAYAINITYTAQSRASYGVVSRVRIESLVLWMMGFW